MLVKACVCLFANICTCAWVCDHFFFTFALFKTQKKKFDLDSWFEFVILNYHHDDDGRVLFLKSKFSSFCCHCLFQIIYFLFISCLKVIVYFRWQICVWCDHWIFVFLQTKLSSNLGLKNWRKKMYQSWIDNHYFMGIFESIFFPLVSS